MLTMLKGEQSKPYNIMSLDSEADEHGETYVWCVYGLVKGKEIKRTFEDRTKVVKYLFKQRHDHTILTGVNIAFDLNTLLGKDGFNWNCIYNMGRLITASPNKKDMNKLFHNRPDMHLKIMDLGNFILNTSLKGMADMFNITCHIDKHILEREGKEEMYKACMSHAKTGVLVMQELQKQILKLGGNIKVTGAASAMDLFRRKYLKPEFQIWDFKYDSSPYLREWDKGNLDQARADKTEYMKNIGRLAYVGGRCENFKLGLFNDCDYLDINSSYPFQMKTRTYPNMNTYRRRSGDQEILMKYIEEYEGEANISIKAPKLNIPFLHCKDEEDKLIFPLGTFGGWYTFPEIKKAVSLGYKITEVKEIAIFDRMESPFIEYVNDLMKLKKQPDTKQAAKLMMNGLSGKFGQLTPNTDKWEIVENTQDIEVDYKSFFDLNGLIWFYNAGLIEEKESEFRETAYPLIVAYITAWGRIQEYEAIEAIGFDKVYYMDTDSIIGDHEAIQAAIKAGKIKIDEKELGAYKLEHEGATVQIKGLKYYRIHDQKGYLDKEHSLNWTYHIKGVPSRCAAEHWQHGKSAYYRPRKIKTALRENKKVNEFIRVFHGDKVKRDNKRIFTGKNSIPKTVNL